LGAVARGALCGSVGASPERRIFPKSSGARAVGASARNVSTNDAGA